ncbi:MAG: alginate lyase family protein [Victivallales bacterium]|nr:alginate lyase family protein [Victivallales bacterium]
MNRIPRYFWRFVGCGVLVWSILAAQISLDDAGIPPRVILDTRDAANWLGGTLEPETVCPDGSSAIRWEHAKEPALRVVNIPSDWTGPHDAIECWLYSQNETNASFVIIFNSENPDTEGQDYYSTTVKLSFTGWRKFIFPLKSMERARRPLGWNQITGVVFTAEGWGNTPDPRSVVNLGQVRLVKLLAEHGPRLADREFFDCLNLDYPGLEAVKAAANAEDFAAAKTAFVKHLKTREQPRWHFDWRQVNAPTSRNPGFNLSNADKFAANCLVSCGIWHQFGERIEWSFNPTEHNYHEWTWGLSRHVFWQELGKAYWATGDEKYARAFVAQLRSWIIDNPVPFSAGNVPYSRWRTIETGIRAYSSWPDAFHYFLGSPSFDDDSIFLMVKSFYEHAVHLRSFPQRNNWLCMEMNGLYHIGTLFPEFKEASAWREYAANRLYEEMSRQVYPDGAQVELAPGYHGLALDNFLGLWKLARLNRQTLPEDYVLRLEKMYGMYLNVTSPDGRAPAVNDSSWIDTRAPLLEAARLFPQRSDFLYWGTGGQQGTPPAFTSTFMPYAGWFTMRSGWGPQDLWLHFEAGPFGAGHQHEDKLSFVIHAYGTRLLTEGGVYAYDASQWRKYVLSAAAHNVVRIDRLDQNRRDAPCFNLTEKPLDNRWITNELFDFAEGTYSEGFGPGLKLKVSHSRAILFVKPHYWLLFDVLTPPDDLGHEYTTWFHFNTDHALALDAPHGYLSDEPGSAKLLIAPLNPDGLDARLFCGQEQPEVQGWIPAEGLRCRPVATPTFVRKAKGAFAEAYLIYPVKAQDKLPIKKIRRLDERSFELLFHDGTRHAIQFSLGNQHLKSLRWNAFDQHGTQTSCIVIE